MALRHTGPSADSRSCAQWLIRSRAFAVVVSAVDQWEAWDTLKARPIEDFGLIVVAEMNENADPIPVQTETLMRRWGRDADAEMFSDLAVQHGLKPSTPKGKEAPGAEQP